MSASTAVNVRREQDKYSASYAGLKSGRPGNAKGDISSLVES